MIRRGTGGAMDKSNNNPRSHRFVKALRADCDILSSESVLEGQISRDFVSACLIPLTITRLNIFSRLPNIHRYGMLFEQIITRDMERISDEDYRTIQMQLVWLDG